MLEIQARKTYIGVTGVTNLREAQILASTFNFHLSEASTHQGAIGYRVTSHLLEGVNNEPFKFPDLQQLPLLLAQSPATVLNSIHFQTDNRAALATQVKKLFAIGDIYRDELCQTLQLNVRWPDVSQVEEIKNAFPELQIILSLTPNILRRRTREEITQKVGDYEELIDYIAIDPSGSKGKVFEASWVAPYYRVLKNDFPNKQIILAGGFNPTNVQLRLAQITHVLRSGDFGIDAESGLRDKEPNNRYGRFSLPKAIRYIQTAAAFFTPNNSYPLSPN